MLTLYSSSTPAHERQALSIRGGEGGAFQRLSRREGVPSTRKLGLRKREQSLSVQMTDLLFLRRADGSLIQKGAPLLIRAERIIDREQNAVSSHDLQSEQQRWIGEEAAGRNM